MTDWLAVCLRVCKAPAPPAAEPLPLDFPELEQIPLQISHLQISQSPAAAPAVPEVPPQATSGAMMGDAGPAVLLQQLVGQKNVVVECREAVVGWTCDQRGYYFAVWIQTEVLGRPALTKALAKTTVHITLYRGDLPPNSSAEEVKQKMTERVARLKAKRGDHFQGQFDIGSQWADCAEANYASVALLVWTPLHRTLHDLVSHSMKDLSWQQKRLMQPAFHLSIATWPATLSPPGSDGEPPQEPVAHPEALPHLACALAHR